MTQQEIVIDCEEMIMEDILFTRPNLARNGEEIKDWHYCYECGVQLFGKIKKKDMVGITQMFGDCSRCGKKHVGLIPVDDFLGQGD